MGLRQTCSSEASRKLETVLCTGLSPIARKHKEPTEEEEDEDGDVSGPNRCEAHISFTWLPSPSLNVERRSNATIISGPEAGSQGLLMSVSRFVPHMFEGVARTGHPKRGTIRRAGSSTMLVHRIAGENRVF